MGNLVKITKEEKRFVITGNHECHAPVVVSDEESIFRELREIVKYFFPERFEFDCSGSEISELTIAGLEGAKRLYDFATGKYCNQRRVIQQRLDQLREKYD